MIVALSQDNQFSNDDFILREIDVGGGGNALGLGLRPNGNDYCRLGTNAANYRRRRFYVIVHSDGDQDPLFSSPTPEISLRSENLVNLSSVTTNQASRSGRPSTDRIGNYVAFESFQNGFNQVFVQNIITGQTVRVTNGFNGANPNGSSYAPVISADGRYMLFFIPLLQI